MVCGPSTPHLGELVGEMQEAAADAQLDRHKTTVWGGDAVDFLACRRIVSPAAGPIVEENAADDLTSLTRSATLSMLPRGRSPSW
jgi:hypothetical protein